MRIRAALVNTALWVAFSAGAGCTHAGGKLPVDAPKLVPYKAPDIDDITGIDSSDDAETAAPAPKAEPAQNPHK